MASRGLIVAIDNVSGHYRPGWKLLEQAVLGLGGNADDSDPVIGDLLGLGRMVREAGGLLDETMMS